MDTVSVPEFWLTIEFPIVLLVVKTGIYPVVPDIMVFTHGLSAISM